MDPDYDEGDKGPRCNAQLDPLLPAVCCKSLGHVGQHIATVIFPHSHGEIHVLQGSNGNLLIGWD